MKNVLIAGGLVLVIVLVAVISLTVYSHNSRQNEVEETLAAAAEQALENLMMENEYDIHSTEEFIADFTQRLVLGLDSNSTITVNILAVDIEKGLLDVEVVETYRQLNGTTGRASYRKTVIFDEMYADASQLFNVTFQVGQSYGSSEFVTYKKFQMSEGCAVIFPGAEPTMEGRTFQGWSLTKPTEENGYQPPLVSEMDVHEDLVFYAVFA